MEPQEQNPKEQHQHPQEHHKQRKSSLIFSSLASIPSVTAARLLRHPPSSKDPTQAESTTLHVDYSIVNHSRLIKEQATQSIHLIHPHSRDTGPTPNPGNPIVIQNPLQFNDPQILHRSLSPTGAKLALFRTSHDSQGQTTSASDRTQPRFRIDIWDNSINALQSSNDLTSAHRAFILNSTFGFPSWNSSETCLAYVAEGIQPEKSSWLERNRYRPDFGEQLTAIVSPAIFILSVDHQPASIQSPNPSRPSRVIQLTGHLSDSNHSLNVAFAQPVFGRLSSDHENSDHHQVFCTGFASLPDDRRLGLIYCQNRPSAIYEFKFKIPSSNDDPLQDKPIKALRAIQTNLTRISDSTRSARSPYVVDDDRIAYISNTIGGPHASCASFHLYNSRSHQHTVLVGPVHEPPPLSAHVANPFSGLYLDQIPSQATLIDPTDPKKIVLLVTSICGSNRKPVTIEVDSGLPTTQDPPNECSATLLGTDGHLRALFILSKTNVPPQLWIATLFRLKELHLSWSMVSELKSSTDLQLSKLESRVITLPMNDMGPTEVVLTTPKVEILHQMGISKSSLIVVPHGGPHSTSANEFSPSTASMALLGYSMAYINYPGSLGFGQKWVSELPKNLSITDVESCKLALEYLISLDYIKELKVEDRIFISGGSHGGFITAHLTSRYPDLFRAACLRNPVVDLVGTASGGSDIPDWSYAEVDLTFPILNSSEHLPQPQPQQDGKISVNCVDFVTLRNKSPIKFINNVKTPTLVLLGSQDRRVSHQQGLAWYHGIKRLNGVRTELILFDKDSHPLSSVSAQLNSFIAWLEFLSPYSHLSS